MTKIITDDFGYHWKYSHLRGKIYCLEAELEYIENGDEEGRFENGYYADDIDDGIEMLIEYGYITAKSD